MGNFELFQRGSRPDQEINTCDRSAYQMAKKAQTHAEGAKKKLDMIQEQVEDALRETEPVRNAVSQAKEKTTEVNEQARDVELTIREYNDKILTLVDEIRDFLEADRHTDPANIL